MPNKKSRRQIHPGYERDMVTFMLTLERPPAEQLRHQDRGQKYSYLKQSAYEIRQRLVEWIDENGLTKDVERVSEPTVFNTLFITSTTRAAVQLSKAPGVVDVAPTGDVGVDLLAEPGDEPTLPDAPDPCPDDSD